MRAMRLSRSSRSVIALVTAVLLLLCQTAFAAQACGHGFVSDNASAVSAPCYEAMDDSQSVPKDPAALSDCDAPKAIAEAVKVQVLSITDFPALQLARYEPAPVRLAWLAPHAVHATQRTVLAAGPPKSILFCSFRI
jgi:hypothetical protein